MAIIVNGGTLLSYEVENQEHKFVPFFLKNDEKNKCRGTFYGSTEFYGGQYEYIQRTIK